MRAMEKLLDRLLAHTKLEPEEQSAFLGLPGEARHVRGYGKVVRRGEAVDSCCVVGHGMIVRVGATMLGARQIEALYLPGDIPDLHALLLPWASGTLEAACDSHVLGISRKAIQLLVARYPAIGEALWRETMMEAAISNEWILNIGQRPAPERICHLVCETAVRTFGEPPQSFDFHFPLTQTQIAEATGLSIIHVNRVLQSLRKRKMFEMFNRTVKIFEWDALRAFAGFDQSYLHAPSQQRFTAAPQRAEYA